MSKNSAFDLIAQFMGRQNTIPVPMPFVRILGDYTSAAFLSQCIYWCDRTDDADAWFYKSHDEWAAELHLSSDQVRRCVKTCGGMVEVKRAGIPARNYYRVNQDLVTVALQNLANEMQNATSRSGETQQLAVDKPNDSTPTNPTTSRTADPTSNKGTKPTSEPTQNLQQNKHTPDLTAGAAVFVPEPESGPEGGTPQVPVSDQTAPTTQANEGESKAEGLDTVPAAPKASKLLSRLLAAYNEHRGNLPAAESANAGREKAAKVLARYWGSPDVAVAALAEATQQVATEEFWRGKSWGFDNLLPKVAQKVEAWHNRAAPPPPTSTTSPGEKSYEERYS